LEELHYLGVDIVWHCSQVSVPLRLKATKLTGVPGQASALRQRTKPLAR
jgi:hypothetical protein